MTMKKRVFGCVAIWIMLGAAMPAHASQTVTSPYVTEGQSGIELKGGYKFDDKDSQDHSWQTKIEAYHNPTSFWQVKIGADFQKLDEQDTDFSSINLENKFQLAKPGVLFVDPGLRIKYLKAMDGTPDEVEVKLLLGKKTEKVDHLANIIARREVGEDHDSTVNYGFSYSGAYKFTEDFKLGAEWYSDFKDFDNNFRQQGHQLGPVAYGKLGNGFGYQAGVLFGVSDSAPDALIKTVIDYKF